MKPRTPLRMIVMLAALALISSPLTAIANTTSRAQQLATATGNDAEFRSVNDGASFAQSGTRVCSTDPTGDVLPAGHPRSSVGDMREVCIDDSDTPRFTVNLVENSNPATDPSFGGITGWLVDFDIDSNGSLDYTAIWLASGDGTYGTSVYDADFNYLCDFVAGFDDTGYWFNADLSCINATGSANIAVSYDWVYDLQPHGEDDFLYDDSTNTGPFTDSGTSQPTPEPEPDPQPVSDPTTDPATGPSTTRTINRLAGQTRHETSVAISKFEFSEGADRVYLSRDDNFADSISGASLTGGPVLLVPQCGTVPTVVLDEVRRLGASEIIALGGTAAVCDQVLTDVANA